MEALEFLRNALAEYTETPAAQIVPEAQLSDVGVDSLTLAELIFDLESKYGIDLPDNTARPATVADLVALIAPHLQKRTESVA
jgi:acyl carrier protein